MIKANQTTSQGILGAMNPKKGLGWNPWKGPAKELGAYQSTLGAGDSLYRDPSKGDSPWLSMQNSRIGAQTAKSQDDARAGAAGAGANAWSQLASMGGVRSGTAQNLAENSSNTGMLAAQDAGFQGNDLQMQAGIQDATMNAENQRFDVTNRMTDAKGRNDYDQAKYGTEMTAWAAKQQADATRPKDSKCCFIFLEARYGNGVMDSVVRRFRDEQLTPRNQRGYYKLSQVLVPLMRKSKFVKFVVQATMTSPLVAYGKAYYGEGSKLGFLFAPVKRFWLKAFDYLGQDHEFVRENGEVI